MSIRQEILDQIEALQSRIQILERFPEDRFHLGTILVFDFNNGTKVYYLKAEENGWTNLSGGSLPRGLNSLEFWILKHKDTYSGYFEVYEMRTQPQPVYASE